jgi:GDPmannose 4,6-dehydratase
MTLAVITGVAGQDGSYLSEYLLSLGYKVIGITKRNSTSNDLSNIKNILDNKYFSIFNGDITDTSFLCHIISKYKPDEWYNLAAMSHVGQSFIDPVYSFKVNAESVINQLDLIKNISPNTKFYQASTSEMFGSSICPPNGYTEDSQKNPSSPYAIAKLSAHLIVENYRKSYGLFCCSGILHNHSSPRRGHDFATRKITNGLSMIKLGKRKKIKMGNLSAFRDEGHSKDYCIAMNLMLNNYKPKDYVISTGSGATIEEMFKYVCSISNIDFKDAYELDNNFIRPSDVPYLLGNSNLARKEIGWNPFYDWKKLLEEMYYSDLYNNKKLL